MKVTAVETAVVEANYDWTFVRIHTDDGLSGLGECFMAPGLTAMIRDLAPMLVGEDARNVDRLWSKLRWAASGAGSGAGIVYNAITGMETALLDVVGKHYGVPVYQLLGGRYRDRVRVYADCHAGEALEAMDCVLVPRRPSWLPAEEPVAAAGPVRPVHGRAHGDASPRGLPPAGGLRRAGPPGGRRARLHRAQVRPRRPHPVRARHPLGHPDRAARSSS